MGQGFGPTYKQELIPRSYSCKYMSQRDIQRLEAIYAQQSNNSRKDATSWQQVRKMPGAETNAKLVSTGGYFE